MIDWPAQYTNLTTDVDKFVRGGVTLHKNSRPGGHDRRNITIWEMSSRHFCATFKRRSIYLRITYIYKKKKNELTENEIGVQI